MQKPLSKEEIQQIALRMGLERALREYPETVQRAAARLTDYSDALPAEWTPTTEPT
jgi:hypothetical protein